MEETDCRARLRAARARVAENEAALLMVPVRLLQSEPADSLAALQTAREAVLAWGASEQADIEAAL